MSIDWKALLRNVSRAKQESFQFHFPIMLQGVIVSRQCAGHACRQWPSQAEPGISLAIAQIHIARGGGGSGLPAINRRDRTIGQSNQHEATTTDPRVMS